MRTRVLSLLLALVWVPFTQAQTTPYGRELQAAYADYLAGSEGDKRAVDRAQRQFESLHATHPDDPLILALLGGSQALQGRDAWMPWNKMRLTEDGLADLARSVQLLGPEHETAIVFGLPVSVHVKSLAGITFTQVPDFFGRFEQGYALLLEVSQTPLLADVPADAHSFIHYYAAVAAKSADEKARQIQLLERLAALPVDDDYTRAAREALTEADR